MPPQIRQEVLRRCNTCFKSWDGGSEATSPRLTGSADGAGRQGNRYIIFIPITAPRLTSSASTGIGTLRGIGCPSREGGKVRRTLMGSPHNLPSGDTT